MKIHRRWAPEGRWNRIATTVVAALLFSSFVGCPLLKKKKAPDEDPGADAATISVTGIGAKNEASVLRYADETPLANEPGTIAKDGAAARNFLPNGPQVAFLPKGTVVAKLAKRFSTGVLIMFDDASGDGTKLVGWVSPTVFDTAAPPPTKPIIVPAIKKDAGAAPTTVQDAGGGGGPTPTSADAGGGRTSPNFTVPTPPRGVQAVPPMDGRCPDKWIIAESMCRKACATDADCDRGIKCGTKSQKRVCTTDK